MVILRIRARFDKLKEEVNVDLGIFAADLVSIMEKSIEGHPNWREGLEDLLLIACQCATMPTKEFWFKCETIVKDLDDQRQELLMGTVKRDHSHLLFILTRCTRLVQFQKESGYVEEHLFSLHKLSDLGVYPEKILRLENIDFGNTGADNDEHEEPSKKSDRQHYLTLKQQEVETGADEQEVGTTNSQDSTASSYKMSSWKKFPSASSKKKECC